MTDSKRVTREAFAEAFMHHPTGRMSDMEAMAVIDALPSAPPPSADVDAAWEALRMDIRRGKSALEATAIWRPRIEAAIRAESPASATSDLGRAFGAAAAYINTVAVPPPSADRAESLDVALQRAVLKFYADQMPAYAAAAGLDRDEYEAVMVDVRRARAEYARLTEAERL